MEDVILEYIRSEYLDEDDDDIELDASTPLITSGIVDSFSMASLKRFLERKYEIQIPDAEATNDAFDTVNSIMALVDRHRGA
jgi:acyl carrier protein/D-alanine--poly(phosphoribitol) ligase subunit 2